MTNFDRIPRFAKTFAGLIAMFLLATAFYTPIVRATSYTYSPDTLTFTPTGQDSVIEYVRVAYNGDTTGPGTYIHSWLSDGSSYFGSPADTVHTRSYFYIRVAYKPQTGTVYGTLSISDDTVTHTVVLIGYPIPHTPAIALEGPYFSSDIHEGGDSCALMRLVNTSNSPDTIHTVSWKHNPNGIFVWDSISLPYILGAYDTTFWTVCFHAPDNTAENIDTLVVYYGSGDANISRIVEAAAITSDGELTAVGPYFPEHIPEGADTCVTMRLVNTGSEADTVEAIEWSHNPNGIFTWDSTSLPFIIAAHDTTYQTFCYHAPDNTDTYTDTLLIVYNDAAGSQWLDKRIVSATASDTTQPDGELDLYDGPYFPTVVDEGHDTCERMMVINSGDDLDTIVSAAWSHNPNGIFTWDSISIPFTMAAHDTSFWTFCFDAPNDTNLYIDTFTVHYHDAYSHDRYSTRIIEAKATDPNITTCYTLYAAAAPVTNYHDTSYIHMYIRNNLQVSASLTSCHISGSDDGSFRVDSSNFPVTIPADSYDSVWLMFIPNRTGDNYNYSATLTAYFTTSDTTDCRVASVSLSGSTPQICSDTAAVNVDSTGSDDVDITGDSTTYYAHRIDVVNNTNATIIVSAVRWLDSSSHFLVTQIVPGLPDTLAPGAGMAVIFHFYGDTGQVYYDTLALTIANGITSHGGKFTPNSSTPTEIYVNIKGATTTAPSAGVSTAAIPNSPELQLYPNPSTGLVNMELEGAANATYEVMDILGQVVASHTGAGIWQWNASSATEAADGTYFVRAISSDASGNALVTTKRLVLQR